LANWCNIRLSVFGEPAAIEPFRKAAGALEGRIRTKRSSIFLPEMEFGEGGDLTAGGVSPFRRRYQRAEYRFQGRNTDHLDHFQEIARRYPSLAFVLTYSDWNGDEHGSHLLLGARTRSWWVPGTTRSRIVRSFYRKYNCVDARGRIDWEGTYSDLADWEAFGQMMGLAARKWDAAVVQFLEPLYRRSRLPKRARKVRGRPAHGRGTRTSR
jgi:hypothetical protein